MLPSGSPRAKLSGAPRLMLRLAPGRFVSGGSLTSAPASLLGRVALLLRAPLLLASDFVHGGIYPLKVFKVLGLKHVNF